MGNFHWNENLALLNAGLSHAGIRFSSEPAGPHSLPYHFRFINNSDGTLRWLFPATLRKPEFLRFYFEGSFRGKVFSAGYRLLFPSFGKRFVSKRITLYLAPSAFDRLQTLNQWALFTGTVGPNRKLVLWHRDVQDQSHFTKLAVSENASQQITAEAAAMRLSAPSGMLIPQHELHGENMLVQQDVFENKNASLVKSVNELPVNALQQWLVQGLECSNAEATSWYQTTVSRLKKLTQKKDKRINPVFLTQLQQLQQCNVKTWAATTRAHGDFTPWNVRSSSDKLVAIDWELSGNFPALYDLFHFIYQQHILINRKPFSEIRKAIDTLFQQPEWISFAQKNNLNIRQAEQYYLLTVITYYLEVYANQKEWHMQIQWLLETWGEALAYWLTEEKIITQRQGLLQGITQILHPQPYAALKLNEEELAQLALTSDLDLTMPKSVAKKLCSYVQQHHAVRYAEVSRKSFMYQIMIVLEDNSTLHLDCIWRFQRKDIVYLSANEIYGNSNQNAFGVFQPQPCNDMRYAWLFHTINGATLPIKYYDRYFKNISRERFALLKEWYDMPFAELEDFKKFSGKTHLHLMELFKSQPANAWHQRMIHGAQYVADSFKSFFQKRGCTITFSGVDGAGKSTVIEATKSRIEKELRKKVVVIRHRPSILPIISAWKHGKNAAEQKAATTLPHQGTNNSRISSLLRFGYYYVDYLLGQFYVHVRYIMRGNIVLYDRYYFDFINDAKRSNISLSSGFTSWWYRFLLKPDFNFFLYAPAEVILARKQEMQSAAIEQMTTKYLGLFATLSSKSKHVQYIPLCNLELNETLHTVFDHIQPRRA